MAVANARAPRSCWLPGGQPDHDGWTSGPAARRVERGGESPMDRVAGRVLPRDVDLPACPALAERLEGGEEPGVDDVLERSEREPAVEALLDARCVHPCCRGQEQLHVGDRVRLVATVGGLTADCLVHGGGDRPAANRVRGLRRRPAVVHEPAHGRDGRQGLLVVHAVARVVAVRDDDAVAPLPGAQRRLGDAGESGSLLDRVHGLYRLVASSTCTNLRHHAELGLSAARPPGGWLSAVTERDGRGGTDGAGAAPTTPDRFEGRS